ncbi:MAG TPA: hypothetical protein VIQ31_02860 [Phormidium sp.]
MAKSYHAEKSQSRSEMLFWRMLDEYCKSDPETHTSPMWFEGFNECGMVYEGKIADLVSLDYKVTFNITENNLEVVLYSEKLLEEEAENPVVSAITYSWEEFRFSTLQGWLIDYGFLGEGVNNND